LLEQLASALEAGYRQLGMTKKQALAGSGELLEDLARAYSDLGRFDQAAQIYGQLVEGLDAAQEPSAYWSAELGYCRCILAARGQDKRAMKSLVVRIAQLKQQDPSMGNLAEQFADIEAQAAQAGE
jgi:tetratricopeptide (TPR) repeat protein